MAELSRAEKLLIAAGKLVEAGQEEFTAEDLVVSAFRSFPENFALKGHSEYPNSNPVLTQIMGKSAPLIIRGWIEKTGTKRYRVTPKGVDEIRALQNNQGGAVYANIERRREESLGGLLGSVAYDQWKSGQRDKVTFHQFCRFAGLSAGDSWQAVQGQLSSVRQLVHYACKLGESGQGLRMYYHGKNVSYEPEDLRSLPALLTFLEERFSREMQDWKRHATG